MSDEVDSANALAEFTLNLALRQHQQAIGLEPVISDLCIDCQGLIPRERRAAVPFCVRCVTCQAIYEHEEKLWN